MGDLLSARTQDPPWRLEQKDTHVQNPLARKPTEQESSKHFSHLACKNTFPSFNVSKWKPTGSPFAFTLSPPIVCHLSRAQNMIIMFGLDLAHIQH
jgi:hypothetical protein